MNQQTNGSGTITSQAFGLAGVFPSAYFGNGYEYASQGSCVIVPPEQGQFNPGSPLDAGTIQLAAPSRNMNLPNGGGALPGKLLPKGPVAAGTYTFTAPGGKDIASFTAAVHLQSPLILTNRAAIATITRCQGATVTWSGGFTNGDVQVEAAIGDHGSVRFFCHAPTGAGQLTIPPSILLGMPAGGGTMVVTNTTAGKTWENIYGTCDGRDRSAGIADGSVESAATSGFAPKAGRDPNTKKQCSVADLHSV